MKGSFFRSRILLVFSLVFALAFASLPVQAQSYRIIQGSASLSVASNNYAMLPIPYKADETLSSLKPAKNDTRSTSISTQEAEISYRFSYGTGPVTGQFRGAVPHLRGVFRKALHQACLMLDVPPPSAYI